MEIIMQHGVELMDLLTIKDISMVGVLIAVIWYFYTENKDLKTRINKIIDEHQNDLRDANKDFQIYLEKWNDLVNDLKDELRRK